MPRLDELLHKPASLWTRSVYYYSYLPPIVVVTIVAWTIISLASPTLRPPVGTYIAILAFLAVVVTIWPPEGRWSKAIWLFVFFFCFVSEIHNLYQDRNEAELERIDSRKQEEKHFEGVLRANQQQFEATMKSMLGLVNLTEQNLAAITGGNSFIAVKLLPGSTNLSLILAATQYGNFEIHQVQVHITDLIVFRRMQARHEDSYIGQYIKLLDLPPHKSTLKEIPDLCQCPNINHRTFNIDFVGSNGDWTEQLQQRRVKEKWYYAIRIIQQKSGEPKNTDLIDKDYPDKPVDWSQ